MNHLDLDETPDWNDDIDAFEQQLRAIRPAPPVQSFSSLAEQIESDQPHERSEEASVSSASPAPSVSLAPSSSFVLGPVISHAVTAAIGLAVGVAMMWVWSPSDPASARTTTVENENTNVKAANDQDSLATQGTDSNRGESESVDSSLANYRSSERRRSHRFSQVNLQSGPLRVFGPIGNSFAEGDFWQQARGQRITSSNGSDDTAYDKADEIRSDRQPISPRSLHLFLDDLTYSPQSNRPFSNEDPQS